MWCHSLPLQNPLCLSLDVSLEVYCLVAIDFTPLFYLLSLILLGIEKEKFCGEAFIHNL